MNVLAFQLMGRRRTSLRGTKLAIFKPDRLGDFVMSLGAIRWLLNRVGEENCVLFISPYAQELSERVFPRVARVSFEPFPRKLWPAWRRFKEQATEPWWEHMFDTAISLRHHRMSWQELVFSRLRSRQKWAMRNEMMGRHPVEERWIRAPLSGEVPMPKVNGQSPCSEFECHRQLLAQAFQTQVNLGDVLPTLDPPVGVKPNGALLMFPFGSSELRTLPVDVVAAGVGKFREIHPLPLRLAAAPSEMARYERYADELVAKGLPRPTIVPTPTISALLEEVGASRVVLTTESAPAHLSVAMNRPTVALLGGGHHGLFGPWTRSTRQIWLDHRMECYHCDWQCSQTEPFCLTRIAPGAVNQALLKVFAEA